MCFLGGLVSLPARAQDTTAVQPSSWIAGGSVGSLGATLTPDERISTLGLHFTQARVGDVGLDLSFGIAPRAIAYGVLLAGTRVGLTLPFQPQPGFMLLPTAGVSFIGIAADGGAAYAPGFNIGGAALIGHGTTRLRTGITWHRMRGTNQGLWLVELGLMNVPGSRVRIPATPAT
ncbi:MAG: hypothetical protein M3Z05_09000 [Gemmatimonadota bacterium]|nr:hypothetical protein [Gemmatimonadota bacterium]